jgi:hypothetical protein
MNQPAQSLPAQRWCWPIHSAHYDRTPELYPDELKELRRKVRKKKVRFARLPGRSWIGWFVRLKMFWSMFTRL